MPPIYREPWNLEAIAEHYASAVQRDRQGKALDERLDELLSKKGKRFYEEAALLAFGYAALPPLVELLGHKKAGVRERALEAAVRLRIPVAAAPAILQMALADRSAKLRDAANAALKKLTAAVGTPDYRSEINASLRDLVPEAERDWFYVEDLDSVVAGLRAWLAEQLVPPLEEAVEAALGKGKTGEGAADLACAAARVLESLGWAGAASTAPLLLRALGLDSVQLRRTAALALRASDLSGLDAPAIPVLVGLLESGDGSLTRSSILILGKLAPLGAEQVVPALQAALTSDGNRREVCESLGAFGSLASGAVPDLLGALNSETKSWTRCEIVRALGTIGVNSPDVEGALVAQLNPVTDSQRVSVALEALRALGAVGARDAICPTLEGPCAAQALEVLFSLGIEQAAGAALALKLLEHPKQPARRLPVVRVLARLEPTAEIVAAFGRALAPPARDTDYGRKIDMRCAGHVALRALARWAPERPDAVRALVEANQPHAWQVLGDLVAAGPSPTFVSALVPALAATLSSSATGYAVKQAKERANELIGAVGPAALDALFAKHGDRVAASLTAAGADDPARARVAEHLRSLLKTEEGYQVANAAARALGSLEVEADAGLVELLFASKAERGVCFKALQSMRLTVEGFHAAYREGAEEALTALAHAPEAAAALVPHLLELMPTVEAYPPILEALGAAGGAASSAIALPPLLELASRSFDPKNSKDAKVLKPLVAALGAIALGANDPGHLEDLQGYRNKVVHRMQRQWLRGHSVPEAAKALAALCPAEPIARVFAERLSYPDSKESWIDYLRVLGSLGPEVAGVAVEPIQRLLAARDTDTDVSNACADALVRMGPAALAALPTLTAVERDGWSEAALALDGPVRARIALAEHDPDAVRAGAIEQLRGDANRFRRKRAAAILGAVPADAESVAALGKALREDAHDDVRVAAGEALAALGPAASAALDTVRAALHVPHDERRGRSAAAAAKALGALGDPRAAADLARYGWAAPYGVGPECLRSLARLAADDDAALNLLRVVLSAPHGNGPTCFLAAGEATAGLGARGAPLLASLRSLAETRSDEEEAQAAYAAVLTIERALGAAPGESPPVIEAKKPEAKKPEAKKPEAKKPEAKKPEAKKPEAKRPEAKKPEAKKPEAKKPEAKKPEAKKPDPETDGSLTRLEFKGGTSSKFWEIAVTGCETRVRYGKIGSKGRSQVKAFEAAAAAQAYAEKQIKSKLKKGYQRP